LHFRNVQSEDKKERLLNADAVFYNDFLDDVSKDVPIGCWSIMEDTTKEIAVIRNNVWAGFTAFHKAATCDFGGVYVGDGFKNSDLCFQLQP